MRRRYRSAKSADNHDRWLVSYADFITLLFAFFVVMFASSLNDKSHAKAVSEAIKHAFSNGGFSPPAISGMANSETAKPSRVESPAITEAKLVEEPKPVAVAAVSDEDVVPPGSSLVDLSHAKEELEASLRSEIDQGSIKLTLGQRGLVISLEAGAFFPSGTAGIAPQAYTAVEKVATVLNTLPNSIRLEGHTDSLPISNQHFQSNWELSASRSIAMLRLLSERFNVDSKRMAIVGYADNEATDSNDTESGRGRNRRVDIVIARDK